MTIRKVNYIKDGETREGYFLGWIIETSKSIPFIYNLCGMIQDAETGLINKIYVCDIQFIERDYSLPKVLFRSRDEGTGELEKEYKYPAQFHEWVFMGEIRGIIEIYTGEIYLLTQDRIKFLI